METEKKLKYHFTLTNNETGECLVDTDTDAIIGAIHDLNRTQGLLVANSDGQALCNLYCITMMQLQEAKKEHPDIYRAAKRQRRKRAKLVEV